MAKVKDHLKSAEDFYSMGVKEYEEGRHLGDLTRIREGCEKVFHASVEAINAIIQKRGFPEPEDHKERWERLLEIGERKILEIHDKAFLYLHSYGYYRGMTKGPIDECIKDIGELLNYVRREVKR